MNSAARASLTVVSAPAGYGKSTLTADWLVESGRPYAWLSLDRSHRDPRVLLRDFAGAIRMTFPDSLTDFVRRLEVKGATEVTTLIRELSIGIERDVPVRLLVVLDDVHLLQKSDASAALSEFVKRPPTNVHVVILTRVWDAIPELARLLSDGSAAAVLEGDLAFDDAEAARLLRRAGMRDRRAIRALVQRAAGWPAALSLLAQHHTSEPDSEPNSTAAFVLSDFLDREVLSRLSSAQLAALEVCGVLEVVDAEVLREVVSSRSLAVTIRKLELHTQLIVRAGDGPVYRVHGLLADHLVQRLQLMAPERLREIRLAAHGAYAQRGELRRATEFALDAGEWSTAAHTIERLLDSLYQAGEWSTIARWIDRLPDGTLEAMPSLVLARARLDTWMRDPNAALLRLNRLRTETLSVEQEALRAAYQAAALRWLGRSAEAVRVADAHELAVSSMTVR